MLQNNAVTATDMRPGRKGKTRLRTLDRIDQRTRSARRTREIIAVLTEALGRVPNAVEKMGIVHAAATAALLEDMQARALSGDASVTIEQLTKASNIAHRAIKQLHLPAASPPKRANSLKPLQWR
jgi:hypothetical protein